MHGGEGEDGGETRLLSHDGAVSEGVEEHAGAESRRVARRPMAMFVSELMVRKPGGRWAARAMMTGAANGDGFRENRESGINEEWWWREVEVASAGDDET